MKKAQVRSLTGLARDSGVERTTVASDLEILHDTLLTFELPAFETRLRVRERKHPRLYWADPGLPRAMRREAGPPSAAERGRRFEGWVLSVLRAYRDYRGRFES